MAEVFTRGHWVKYLNGAAYEVGRVKEVKQRLDGGVNVYVVFNCEYKWNEYDNYTAALTPTDKLSVIDWNEVNEATSSPSIEISGDAMLLYRQVDPSYHRCPEHGNELVNGPDCGCGR